MKRIFTTLFATLLITFFTSSNALANSYGIRFSPLMILAGAVDVSVDVALGSWVLSPEFVTWNLKIGSTETKIQGYGAAMSYHFSGALTDSWYLGGFAKKVAFEASSSNETGKLDTTIIGARAGYLWVWSTFYMNLGGTLGSIGNNDFVIRNSTTGGTRTESVPTVGLGVGLDFKIGFSF